MCGWVGGSAGARTLLGSLGNGLIALLGGVSLALHPMFPSAEAKKVCAHLVSRGLRVLVEPGVAAEEMPEFEACDSEHPVRGVDLVVCIGGDGTLLHMAKLIQGVSPSHCHLQWLCPTARATPLSEQQRVLFRNFWTGHAVSPDDAAIQSRGGVSPPPTPREGQCSR